MRDVSNRSFDLAEGRNLVTREFSGYAVAAAAIHIMPDAAAAVNMFTDAAASRLNLYAAAAGMVNGVAGGSDAASENAATAATVTDALGLW